MGKVIAVVVAFAAVFGIRQIWPWLDGQPALLSWLLVALLAAAFYGLGQGVRNQSKEIREKETSAP